MRQVSLFRPGRRLWRRSCICPDTPDLALTMPTNADESVTELFLAQREAHPTLTIRPVSDIAAGVAPDVAAIFLAHYLSREAS